MVTKKEAELLIKMGEQLTEAKNNFAQALEDFEKSRQNQDARIKNLEDWRKSLLNNTNSSSSAGLSSGDRPAIAVNVDLRTLGPALTPEELNDAIRKMANVMNPIFNEYKIIAGTIKIVQVGQSVADDLNKSLKDGNI